MCRSSTGGLFSCHRTTHTVCHNQPPPLCHSPAAPTSLHDTAVSYTPDSSFLHLQDGHLPLTWCDPVPYVSLQLHTYWVDCARWVGDLVLSKGVDQPQAPGQGRVTSVTRVPALVLWRPLYSTRPMVECSERYELLRVRQGGGRDGPGAQGVVKTEVARPCVQVQLMMLRPMMLACMGCNSPAF
jgi:hypothetical protein